MKFLKQLLQDQPVENFLQKHFTRIPFSMPNAAKDLAHLLNWDVIKKVLDEKKSVTRIVRDGIVTKDYVDVDFETARKYHKDGHTLLLRYAEASDKALKELADDFAKAFRTEVDIQLYCTPAGNNAFGWHYDVEEVFIIQTMGSKLYTIRSNTVHPRPLLTSIPKDLQYEKETSELQLQVLLEAGDWLYIPSGWWHIARTQSESMHISVGLMPRSAVDVAGFLNEYLVQFPYWRTRFPVHKDTNTAEDIKIYQEAFEKLGMDLAEKFKDPEFIKAFIQYTRNKKS
jgi:50S ribosomal protein L16 3-hydroxylase